MTVEISWNSDPYFESYEMLEKLMEKKKSKLELVCFNKVPVYFEFISTKNSEMSGMEKCYN